MAQLAARADGEAAHHMGLQGAPPTCYCPLTACYLLLTTHYSLLTTHHKVLFLDVLFPLKVKRVIYIDSDQLVRAVR